MSDATLAIVESNGDAQPTAPERQQMEGVDRLRSRWFFYQTVFINVPQLLLGSVALAITHAEEGSTFPWCWLLIKMLHIFLIDIGCWWWQHQPGAVPCPRRRLFNRATSSIELVWLLAGLATWHNWSGVSSPLLIGVVATICMIDLVLYSLSICFSACTLVLLVCMITLLGKTTPTRTPLTSEELDRVAPEVTYETDPERQGDSAYASCAICLTSFIEEERVARLQCGHQFHGDCVRPWVKNHFTCPLCRISAAPLSSAD
jgi:hypothetical protein